MMNCSPDCAEINGGHCPGDSCPYRPDGPADRRRRVSRAETALALYRDEDHVTRSTDLLADLMHYLEGDFDACLARARMHYEHERIDAQQVTR